MISVIKKLNSFFTGFFKLFKIDTPKLNSVPEYEYDYELVESLESLARDKNLEKLIKDPVNKICVINTFSLSFADLGSILLDKRYSRKIVAVNIHSYFKDSEHLVSNGFERIAKFIKQQNCTQESIHDIKEIVFTLQQLKSFSKGD